MDGKISEQRVYCKIRAQLGFPPTEIHADLQKVDGKGTLKYIFQFASGYVVLIMVGSQLKMTLGWLGRFSFWWKKTLLLWKR